jgi:hypothetical protein
MHIHLFTINLNVRPPSFYQLLMFLFIFVGPGLLFWKHYWLWAPFCWPVAVIIASVFHLIDDPQDENWKVALVIASVIAVGWILGIFVSTLMLSGNSLAPR